MISINRNLLKGFIISVFFFYYEMRFFPLTLHSIFLFLGLISIIISLAIKKVEKGFYSLKISFDIILAVIFSLIIIIGFILNISTATFSNLQAYLLGVVCYIFVRVNAYLISIDWFLKIVKLFLIINSILILIQFITGVGFVATYFAAGDPLMIIPSGVSDGPTKNGMLHVFAMSLVLGQLIFSVNKKFILNLYILILSFPGLILSASRAAMVAFAIVLTTTILFSLFSRNKKLFRNKKGIFSIFVLASIIVVILINIGVVNILDNESKELKQASDIVLFKLTATQDDSFLERFENINIVESIATKSWPSFITFGIGVGSFETINKGFNIHNSYLEVLLQTGLLGFSVFVTMLIYNFRKLFSSNNITTLIPIFLGLLAIMVFMIFHDILRGRIFWLPLALQMAYSNSSKLSLSEKN